MAMDSSNSIMEKSIKEVGRMEIGSKEFVSNLMVLVK